MTTSTPREVLDRIYAVPSRLSASVMPSHPEHASSSGAVAAPGKYPPRTAASMRCPVPLPASRMVQNHAHARPCDEAAFEVTTEEAAREASWSKHVVQAERVLLDGVRHLGKDQCQEEPPASRVHASRCALPGGA